MKRMSIGAHESHTPVSIRALAMVPTLAPNATM